MRPEELICDIVNKLEDCANDLIDYILTLEDMVGRLECYKKGEDLSEVKGYFSDKEKKLWESLRDKNFNGEK